MAKTLVVILALATVAPALAQSRPNPQANARLGALRPAGSAYRALFQPASPIATAAPRAQSRVVCGTTLVPGDPAIDPKMLMPRASKGVEHTIRAIDPPICNPTR